MSCQDKRRYETREDAEAALAEIRANPERRRRAGDHIEQRAYLCWHCLKFHLSSQPPRQKKAA